MAWKTLDGNEAVARIAYRMSECVAIYPITPASPMGEWADRWAAEGQPNLWEHVPAVVEMQSEGGAAGAVHGCLQGGVLTTTFTASQGLLLMLPNMYKIAGELSPGVIHVAARSIATQALSIFGDHGDVMAARGTGYAMLCSGSVQEAQDMACIAHAATLASRLPFLHFFDGFRTSHEIAKIELVADDDLRALLEPRDVAAMRERGLTPDRPVLRGTAQNPDTYFQSRETVNPYYLACSETVSQLMNLFAQRTGRQYHLFDYHGAKDAERVIVMMGSGAEAAHCAVDALTRSGEKVGLLRVRLYRPFDGESLVKALPSTVKRVMVLDRTKEPGGMGEPLYLDTRTAIAEHWNGEPPSVVGGRYGLGSKEFTPDHVHAVFKNLATEQPRNHVTLGIHDDVTHTSLAAEPLPIENDGLTEALFFGLGSDGTVGANKAAIKMIGEHTDHTAQGYFVYDSKKSGSMTVSHLRFGTEPIRATYLIHQADFVACHQFSLLARTDVLAHAKPGAVFLLNCGFDADHIWSHLPRKIQRQITEKNLRFFVVDAGTIAADAGLGRRINTVMQTCFFAISGVLPQEQAIALIKDWIQTTFGKRGAALVAQNNAAVDQALAGLQTVTLPDGVDAAIAADDGWQPAAECPDLIAALIQGRGDDLPVSAFPADGTYPTDTTRFEKRNIAREVPAWDADICIQCGKCVLVCPHGVIRGKRIAPDALKYAPQTFLSAPARWKDHKDQRFTLQVAAEDCTGCALCVAVCPVKNKRVPKLKAINMTARPTDHSAERANWEFFEQLPNPPRDDLNHAQVKDVQLLEPLFNFSGACAGCGETPYLKLLTQLFGDRITIANATGCSSIYGGNLPTTPWSKNGDGRGPAWSNSLFEDNAEFGLGLKLASAYRHAYARAILARHTMDVGSDLAGAILDAAMDDEAGIAAQRQRVAALQTQLASHSESWAGELAAVADDLVRKDVWIIGGDGWAYDIGFGGLDHVLAAGYDVNVLVLDTEVYSNTGGQMSKSTPRGAVAKFAFGGKRGPKKDLAAMAMTYGNVYVAAVAMGGNDKHTLTAFREAAAYRGPSLIIAYSHCIAHGYDLKFGMAQQKAAVETGYWPLFRYDPRRADQGENPMQLDSKPPSRPLREYTYNESRYTMLAHSQPEAAKALLQQAEADVAQRFERYRHLAEPKEIEAEETP